MSLHISMYDDVFQVCCCLSTSFDIFRLYQRLLTYFNICRCACPCAAPYANGSIGLAALPIPFPLAAGRAQIYWAEAGWAVSAPQDDSGPGQVVLALPVAPLPKALVPLLPRDLVSGGCSAYDQTVGSENANAPHRQLHPSLAAAPSPPSLSRDIHLPSFPSAVPLHRLHSARDLRHADP
jgi:hypothetical protein